MACFVILPRKKKKFKKICIWIALFWFLFWAHYNGGTLVDFCKNSVQIYAQWYCNVYHQGYIHSLNQTDCIEFPYCLCIYLLFFTWRRQWWGYRAHKYFMIYIQVSIKPKPCSRRGVYLLLPSKVRRIKRMLSFF